ncbi:MAG: flagellin, partial [Rhodothermales bacterium]
MSFGDLTRINTNLQAMSSLNALQRTNSEMGLRQMRLATGSRINRAEDDSAGYTIAKKLQARVRGQEKALQNIGDAKSMLTVGEGSLNSVMDILQTMKEKTVQAANDTLGDTERTAVKNELDALSSEIGDILTNSTFNGTSLFSSAAVALTFQVNAEQGDTFTATITSTTVGGLGVATGSLDVSSATSAGTTLTAIDGAIDDISTRIGSIGDSQKRLSFKQDNLTVSMNNYESAR